MLIFINSQRLFEITPITYLSSKQAEQHIVNLNMKQKMSSTWYERPLITSIEVINGAEEWSLKKKDDQGNFFVAMPRVESLKDSIDSMDQMANVQLGFNRQSVFFGDVLEGLDGEKTLDTDSLKRDQVASQFMERESTHLENTTGKNWRKTEGPAAKEQIDLVVRWRMN